jgi:hypothetical protein
MLPRVVRCKLHFGPYCTPRFKYDSVVQDKVRGAVQIIGVTDAQIPWPIGRMVGLTTFGASPVVYGALARAMRRESRVAVMHWWGLSSFCHNRARRALGVPTINEGTHRLLARYAQTERFKEAQRRGQAKNNDPKRRAKIAAAHRGRKRPEEVRRAISAALTGRKRTVEHCQNLSAAHKKRGTWPPKAGRPWTARENAWLRTLPPADIMYKTGRTLRAIYNQRQVLGLTKHPKRNDRRAG